jgi:hypothetical protein
MLLAFRMNIYAKELIPHLVNSLKAIMLNNWNTESIRAVATFLASTVSKGTIPSIAALAEKKYANNNYPYRAFNASSSKDTPSS